MVRVGEPCTRRTLMRSRLHWLLIFTAATAAACSSDSEPNDGGGGAAGTVTVGNIFFKSGHNSTQNPAVDTVAAGTTVTWTWTSTGSTPHSVQSEAEPSFTSSNTLTGNGMTYTFKFTTPGTYHYDCAIHGDAMTGTIVVQ
jgi:plastocyanin